MPGSGCHFLLPVGSSPASQAFAYKSLLSAPRLCSIHILHAQRGPAQPTQEGHVPLTPTPPLAPPPTPRASQFPTSSQPAFLGKSRIFLTGSQAGFGQTHLPGHIAALGPAFYNQSASQKPQPLEASPAPVARQEAHLSSLDASSHHSGTFGSWPSHHLSLFLRVCTLSSPTRSTLFTSPPSISSPSALLLPLPHTLTWTNSFLSAGPWSQVWTLLPAVELPAEIQLPRDQGQG